MKDLEEKLIVAERDEYKYLIFIFNPQEFVWNLMSILKYTMLLK